MTVMTYTNESYHLWKKTIQCNSDNQYLGNFKSVEECATACKKKEGCHFFLYGRKLLFTYQSCYWEKTFHRFCSEGWTYDADFDFYESIKETQTMGKMIFFILVEYLKSDIL